MKTIGIVYSMLHYDVLYIGGGNAANVVADLPENVRIASNDTGITGGIHLWDEDMWKLASNRGARKERGRSAVSRRADHRSLRARGHSKG